MDLTQEEFGARINYSGEYVGRLERGEGQFSVQFIADVHDEFGISTDYLLFGTKQGKAYNTKEDHKFILHAYCEGERPLLRRETDAERYHRTD